MSGWEHVRWSDVGAGDYIKINRRGYGRREGRLVKFHQAENGDWWWTDDLGKPLLDPWWATGAVEKRI